MNGRLEFAARSSHPGRHGVLLVQGLSDRLRPLSISSDHAMSRFVCGGDQALPIRELTPRSSSCPEPTW
jgi:hypothetical protein